MGFIILILIIINIFTLYRYIFNFIFTDMDDFDESLRYSLTPDIISLFRREYWKDQGGEIKLSLFIIVCAISTMIEFAIIKGIIQLIRR